MTDAERLAEGLLIFLKKPGPTQEDFRRWEEILGAHHMHTKVLTQLAEKILHDNKSPRGAERSEAPNPTGEIHEPGAIIESLSSDPAFNLAPSLRHYSSAEGALRQVEPNSQLDRGDGRGGHGGTAPDGPETQL